MNTRVDAMAARLHPILGEGELVRLLLGLFAVHVERLDDEARGVQRAHFWQTALDREEVARLAALLDLSPAAWQDRDELVAWVDALRDAFVAGAVTVPVIEALVTRLAGRYARANRIELAGADADWGRGPDAPLPRLVETPAVRRFLSVSPEPLAITEAVNRGLDEAALALLYVGGQDGPEFEPLLANVETGQGLIFHGTVPPGARLWISPAADGGVVASLDGADVTDRLRSVPVVPGVPWTPADEAAPRALTLRRGANRLWFMPVAQFDRPGLDRALLALAELTMQQGRYEAGRFDSALFHQPAAVRLHLSWQETAPARFRIELPAHALRHDPGRLAVRALPALTELADTLGRAVDLVAAAGVAGEVALVPARTCQHQFDRLRVTGPVYLKDGGSIGDTAPPDSAARFDQTGVGRSLFR